MRACAAFLGISAIWLGLLVSPFVHVHLEGDFSHEHEHSATVHAHFLDRDSVGHTSSGLEIEGEHHRHHGSSVNALAANSRKSEPMLAAFRVLTVMAESSDSSGHAVELPVRVHDPPSLRNSNPRSPPFC